MQGYKDSGIEWIGSIPEEWNIGRMKYITDIIMGQSPESFQIRDDEGRYLFMQGNSEFGDKYPKAYKYCDNPKKISRANDILMSVRAPVGALNISDVAYGIGRGLCSISAINIDKNYLWFFLNKSKDDFQFFSNGSTFEAITIESLANFPVLIPGREQQQIADYLDEECKRIDRITEKVEKQIEILKEYKKSLIAETVTKGLNKNVKMKDSGVEWIGEVPEYWEIDKVKYIASLYGRIGWQGLTSNEYIEEGPYLITGVDFSKGTIDWNNCVHISEERWNQANKVKIKNGDLLITKDGTVGKVALVNNLIGKASLNSGVLLIDLNIEKNKKFLFWVLSSEVFWTWFNYKNSGNSTILHLYQKDFDEFKYAMPSLKEQQQIADFLDKKCSEIDLILSKKAKQLDIIKEHKKSLIYEYVTGKKRVGGIENGD